MQVLAVAKDAKAQTATQTKERTGKPFRVPFCEPRLFVTHAALPQVHERKAQYISAKGETRSETTSFEIFSTTKDDAGA